MTAPGERPPRPPRHHRSTGHRGESSSLSEEPAAAMPTCGLLRFGAGQDRNGPRSSCAPRVILTTEPEVSSENADEGRDPADTVLSVPDRTPVRESAAGPRAP